MKRILIPLVALLLLVPAACTESEDDKARPLMSEIDSLMAARNYPATLAAITRLRRDHPKAIESRRRALKIWQEASLLMTQQDIGRTDSALQATIAQIDTARTIGERNWLRYRRDSLQVRYDALCGTVRVIHRRQSETDASSVPTNFAIAMSETKTEQEFKGVMTECRTLFEKKLHDYGASWRILRPSSLTDQLYIKAKRIRTLETTGEARVHEGIRPEYMALVNYGIVGLIQLERGYADKVDVSNGEAMSLYERYADEALQLMLAKNHDYGEAWREMRTTSYTDFILTKLQRVKEIEDLNGQTLVSEGIAANYEDIINYAVFGCIKLKTVVQQSE